MITHVAIWYRLRHLWGDEHKLFSLPSPNRHHHIIHEIFKLTGATVSYSWQGFLTDTGKFVGRKEACKIARRCGQLDVVHPKTSPKDVLFSEDVW